MRWTDVRVHYDMSGAALEALRVFAPFDVDVVVDYDPPRAFLADGVTKAPEIEISIATEQERSVVAVLGQAGIHVYSSRTRLDGPLTIPEEART